MYRKDTALPRTPAPGLRDSRILTNTFRALATLLLFGILGGLYFYEIRPAQLRWGATSAEVAGSMPDDGVVADPVFNATRAITIDAPPSQIWPWLIQMGFGRAGFYGYDLIENLGSGRGLRSSQTIVPAFQNPKPGDELPLSIAATLQYGPIQPDHVMIWRSSDVPCDGTFVWELVPIDATHTRLISRIRWNYANSPGGFVLDVFSEFTDHVAMRRILQGIKERAEGGPPHSNLAEGFDTAALIVAAFNLFLGLYFIGFWQNWLWGWLLALGAGLLLELVFYASLPTFVRNVLPWLYLVLLLWAASRLGGSRFGRRSAFA